jgi:hypothetical protein
MPSDTIHLPKKDSRVGYWKGETRTKAWKFEPLFYVGGLTMALNLIVTHKSWELLGKISLKNEIEYIRQDGR